MLDADSQATPAGDDTATVAGSEDPSRSPLPRTEAGPRRRWPARMLMLLVPLALAAIGGYV